MRAETAIFVVVFKKAESSEMTSIGEVFEDFILLQESVIRGHHRRYGLHDLAKFFWLTKKPEMLTDRRAVALLKVDRNVVGHAPREFSRVF